MHFIAKIVQLICFCRSNFATNLSLHNNGCTNEMTMLLYKTLIYIYISVYIMFCLIFLTWEQRAGHCWLYWPKLFELFQKYHSLHIIHHSDILLDFLWSFGNSGKAKPSKKHESFCWYISYQNEASVYQYTLWLFM